jgi:hypothetical protein
VSAETGACQASIAAKGKNPMNVMSLRRHTGIFGLIATIISLVQLPLYFMYPGAPPQWNVLTRIFFSIVGTSILIVFLCGFRLIRSTARSLQVNSCSLDRLAER